MKRRPSLMSAETGPVTVYVGEHYDTGRVLYEVAQGGAAHGDRLAYAYEYALSTLTADVGVVARHGGALFALLVRRGGEPFQGCWALPGGFVDIATRETPKKAAARELREETGLELDRRQFTKIYAKASPDRDPRGYTTTILYGAQVELDEADVVVGDDASDARWVELNEGNFADASDTETRGAFELVADSDGVVTRAALRGRRVPMAFDHAHLCRKLQRHYEKEK